MTRIVAALMAMQSIASFFAVGWFFLNSLAQVGLSTSRDAVLLSLWTDQLRIAGFAMLVNAIFLIIALFFLFFGQRRQPQQRVVNKGGEVPPQL